MKQGRFISVVALALCLVVGIGILYSTLYAGCYCYVVQSMVGPELAFVLKTHAD